jgi:hypothetical protein
VYNSILDEEYDINEDFLDALVSCKECAKTCDAADNLCKHVFYNENCKSLKKDVSIATIKCSRWNYDYYEFYKEIENIFYSEGLDTEKGFVYIFWTASPVEYFYVGKTNVGIPRLKRGWPGAVQSSKETTNLTIIYPFPNKDNSINNVEASIIKIIGIDNLTYNKKEEPFTEGNSVLSQKLSELEKFFSRLSGKFRFRQKEYT